MSKTKSINVKILSKEYQVACPDGSESQLYDASQYLDIKMKEIRNSGRVIGQERIAIMAALNIAHELLVYRQQKEEYVKNVSLQISRLQDKIDEVLFNSSVEG